MISMAIARARSLVIVGMECFSSTAPGGHALAAAVISAEGQVWMVSGWGVLCCLLAQRSSDLW
ncbi:hypothetical protein BJB45_10150 [Halomonas huangheensis]|uniref:Uncharacterized protein n=1 Tax=Halomonas huangheensis TaxID=1178482 RepID=W1N9Y7_9GAMM|nr:hypothetical protein BJB45_10150 [Halomonas huangheensis]